MVCRRGSFRGVYFPGRVTAAGLLVVSGQVSVVSGWSSAGAARVGRAVWVLCSCSAWRASGPRSCGRIVGRAVWVRWVGSRHVGRLSSGPVQGGFLPCAWLGGRRSGCLGSGQRRHAAKPAVRLGGGGRGVGRAGQGPFFFTGAGRIVGCCSRACVSLLGQRGRGSGSWCMFQGASGAGRSFVCWSLCVSGVARGRSRRGRGRIVVWFTSLGGWVMRRCGGGCGGCGCGSRWVRMGHIGEAVVVSS